MAHVSGTCPSVKRQQHSISFDEFRFPTVGLHMDHSGTSTLRTHSTRTMVDYPNHPFPEDADDINHSSGEEEAGWQPSGSRALSWSIYQGRWRINKHLPEVTGSNGDKYA